MASGSFDYQLHQPYLLRLSFQGAALAVSTDGGHSFAPLGAASADPERWKTGRFGLVSHGGAAQFDDTP